MALPAPAAEPDAPAEPEAPAEPDEPVEPASARSAVIGVALGAVALLVAGPGEGLVRGRFVVRVRGQRLGHRRVLLGTGWRV